MGNFVLVIGVSVKDRPKMREERPVFLLVMAAINMENRVLFLGLACTLRNREDFCIGSRFREIGVVGRESKRG